MVVYVNCLTKSSLGLLVIALHPLSNYCIPAIIGPILDPIFIEFETRTCTNPQLQWILSPGSEHYSHSFEISIEVLRYRQTTTTPGGGVLSGKVGTGMCGPDRVLFRALRFCNGPFFI